jgi:hypothetical protein
MSGRHHFDKRSPKPIIDCRFPVRKSKARAVMKPFGLLDYQSMLPA